MSAAGDWADASARGRVARLDADRQPGRVDRRNAAARPARSRELAARAGSRFRWRQRWPRSSPSPDRRDAPREDGGGLRVALGDPAVAALAARGTRCELGLARHAGLRGRAVRRDYGTLIGRDRRAARARGGRVRARQPRLPPIRPRRVAEHARPPCARHGAARRALRRRSSGAWRERGAAGSGYPSSAAAEPSSATRTAWPPGRGGGLPAMAARAAANQLGTFLGAATAGAALAAGGYSLFGFVLALEFVLSTLPLTRRRRGPATLPARLRRAAALARAR